MIAAARVRNASTGVHSGTIWIVAVPTPTVSPKTSGRAPGGRSIAAVEATVPAIAPVMIEGRNACAERSAPHSSAKRTTKVRAGLGCGRRGSVMFRTLLARSRAAASIVRAWLHQRLGAAPALHREAGRAGSGPCPVRGARVMLHRPMATTRTDSIRRLSSTTASHIAAGEVIERPLSALKEILENALDAGATRIEVRVDRSLDHAFSVADDGCGIDADELDLALERHATSKIATLEDLDRLASLGFRGEALPSVAAVSRLRLESCARDAEDASFVTVAGGSITARGRAPRAPGTTVEVAELFFNTPARRKFLHSGAGELRAALRLLEAFGLAFPGVSFRFLVDDRQRFDWPAAAGSGVEGRRERAATLWGTRHAEQRIEVAAERDGLVLEALLGLPEHARATREGQLVFVNRRWIVSPLLAQALRQAYGNLLPAGRFPAATLWLTIPPGRVNVNVHPTKREVRFADEHLVFALVAGACARPLAGLHPPFTVVQGGASESRWSERVAEQPRAQTYLRLEPPPPGTTPEAAVAPSPKAPAPRA